MKTHWVVALVVVAVPSAPVIGDSPTIGNIESPATTGSPISQPTLDGNLSDMKALVEYINTTGAYAFAVNQLDNITNSGCAVDTGVDGFQDEPTEAEATPNGRHMHSPINIGNSILIYVPDSDGVVSPATEDDSWLAIGVNIANGDGDVCIDNPSTPADECAGACKLTAPPDLPLNTMVPFDADGNGDPCTLGTGATSRWFPFEPVLTFDENSEAITLEFFLCVVDPDDLVFDQPIFDVVYQQRFSFATQLLVNGISPSSVQIFPPPSSTCAQIRDRALQRPPPVFPDGLSNNDFEILISNVDSQVSTHFPGENYFYETRFRLANLGVTIRSDASADNSGQESMFILASLPLFGGDCNGNGTDDICEGQVCVPGSCCRADATCTFSQLVDCFDGLWTLGESCDPLPCDALGACCAENGTCTLTDAGSCTVGVWNLGQSCIPNACPQPGSCCRSDGSCTVSLETACGDGVWTLAGSCAPNNCPQPGACCATDGACSVGFQADCASAAWTLGGTCSPSECAMPATVAAVGSRYLAVTPDGSSAMPVSLAVTSDDPPCLNKYVDVNGLLGDVPVFRTPDQWGTVYVGDEEIVPDSQYQITVDNGVSAAQSVAVTTWKWGDVNNSGAVDLDDILCVLAGFGGGFTANCTLHGTDLIGGFFNPDRAVTLDDILAVLSAFGGAAYPGDAPCP